MERMVEGGGFLDHLSDGDSDDGHAPSDAAPTGMQSLRPPVRGVGGREGVKTPDMSFTASLETANKHTHHLRDHNVMPSLAHIRQSLSRPTTSATTRTGRSASSSSVSAAPDFGLNSVIDEIEALLEEGRHRDAAWKAVEGIRAHPRSEELRQLAHEATESIKRFPRFKEALAFVTLSGPTGKVVIGNKLDVAYTYSHMTPKTEFKKFTPFSKAVKEKVAKHDRRMEYLERNLQKPTDAASPHPAPAPPQDGDGSAQGSQEAIIGGGKIQVQGLPEKRPELGEGWTEEEQRSVHDLYSDMKARFTMKEMVAAAIPLLREGLADEAEPMLRMLRLYDKVQNLDAVNLCNSDQHHNLGDTVCLFKVGEKRTDAEGNEEDVEVWVGSQTVPPTDEGSISFSECALSEGTHEFRYMMDGSDTPACISASFVTVKPLATIGVPPEVVPCGDPFAISYTIQLTRPHSAEDWIGIYKLTGYGPNGCVMRIPVPEGNEGTIDIGHTPDFPGDYHAQYHLGAHSDAVVGTSVDFSVRLRVPAKGIETREVRIFVCSTVTDMQAEREAIVHHVVPELQKFFEERFLTVTLIPMSWGTRNKTDYARESITLQDLKIGLAEVEACRPFFIAILGERRGDPPPPCDDETVALYPWLRGQRLERYALPGKYSSLLELQVLNGFLVQPEAARHAVFYMRDPDFARRAGLDRRELSKYLPDSELGRDAVQVLKEELRQMACKYHLFENTQLLSESLIEHLKAAIESEHPMEEWTNTRRISVVNDLIAAHLVERMTTLHPSFSNLSAQVEAFFEEGPEPVVLKGGAGTGISTLMASVAHAHFVALLENEEVDWGERGKREWGKGATAFSYWMHGRRHLFLLQLVGHEMAVATDAEVLEHAMRVSVEELALDMVIPWHPEDLIELFPEWMDRVCSVAKFTWMIDGVDQMLGARPLEAICSQEARVKVEAEKNPRATNRGGGVAAAQERETLSDIEDKEKHKLLTARNHAQMNLRRWLFPMIDLTSSMCAPTRFPNLHLVMSTIDADSAELLQLLRPLDSSFQLLIDGSRSVPKVIEMQAWGPEPRRKYIMHRLREITPGVPDDVLTTAQEYLLHASRPPTEASGADATMRDRFGTTHFMASCVDDVLALCEEKTSLQTLEDHFQIMDKCDTLDALLVRQLKNLQRRVPGAETAFKMLYLSRVGLREMELFKFVGDKEDVTGEELTMMLRRIRPVTSKVAGYIQLRSNYQRCAWRLFKSVDTRLELTSDMASHFLADTNLMRRAQEGASLLLRQSKTDQLLDFLCNQENLPYIGKADVLRYAKAVGWGSEAIAFALKRCFEEHFGVGSAVSGKRYDMQKLMEQVDSLKLGVLKPEEGHHTNSQKAAMEESRVPHQFSVLPSQRRKWMYHNRLLNFCERSLDTVDLLLRLDATALETAEGMLESLVKFLHQADSLALVSERSTKYPMQSLKGISMWTSVFSRAISSLPVVPTDEVTSPNMRQDKKAMHHSRAVHELIHAKVKLLVQAVQRIQEDTSSAARWKEVVSGDLLLEARPEGVQELADSVQTGLKMLFRTMSGEGADDVPKLAVHVHKARAKGAGSQSC